MSSREERKLAAIMKQFEKMEQKEAGSASKKKKKKPRSSSRLKNLKQEKNTEKKSVSNTKSAQPLKKRKSASVKKKKKKKSSGSREAGVTRKRKRGKELQGAAEQDRTPLKIPKLSVKQQSISSPVARERAPTPPLSARMGKKKWILKAAREQEQTTLAKVSKHWVTGLALSVCDLGAPAIARKGG